MYDRYPCFDNRAGFDLEYALTELLKEHVEVTLATKKQDRDEGTDVFIYRVRFDYTLNFRGKDRTERIGCWRGKFNDWDIGVRTGNSYGPFEEPVIVFGVDAKPSEAQKIIGSVRSDLGDIDKMLDHIFTLYWAWTEKRDRQQKKYSCNKRKRNK